MPQIAVEYSANLADQIDLRRFALDLHAVTVELTGTDLESCKTRLNRIDKVLIGDGASHHAMLHIEVRLLSGRSSEIKAALGKRALDLAVAALGARAGHLEVQLTALVSDLEANQYHKSVRTRRRDAAELPVTITPDPAAPPYRMNQSSTYRVKSDFRVDFTNGGYVEAEDFILDIEGDDVTPERLAEMIVSAMNLLRAGPVTIKRMAVVRRGEHQDVAPAVVPNQ